MRSSVIRSTDGFWYLLQNNASYEDENEDENDQNELEYDSYDPYNELEAGGY